MFHCLIACLKYGFYAGLGNATRPGNFRPGFFDPEKNLILNPEVPEEPGPDFKFSPKTGPDPEKLENTEIKKKY